MWRKLQAMFLGDWGTAYSRTMFWLLMFDLLALIGACRATSIKALSVIVAVFVIGAGFGFLFGIPQVRPKDTDTEVTAVNLNNNLMVISDWLTKGITVLTVAQLHQISDLIYGTALQLQDKGGFELPAAAIALMLVGGAVLGFAHTYIWATFEFVPGIRDQENKADQLLAECNQKVTLTRQQQLDDRFRSHVQSSILQEDDNFGWPENVWKSDPLANEAKSYLSNNGEFQLQCTVGRAGDASSDAASSTLWRVRATVSRTDGQRIPATVQARILLHPTYGDMVTAMAMKPHVEVVGTGTDGAIRYEFLAVDGFVLGADIEFQGRRHELRLDLVPLIAAAV